MPLHPSPSISTLIFSPYLRLGLSHCITQWLYFVFQIFTLSFEFGLMFQKLPNSVRTKCLRFRFELSLSHLSSELSYVRFSLVNPISQVVRGRLVSHLNAVLHGCSFMFINNRLYRGSHVYGRSETLLSSNFTESNYISLLFGVFYHWSCHLSV